MLEKSRKDWTVMKRPILLDYRSWHANCLRCTICYTLLDNHASCFLREEQLFCKVDYTK